MPRAKILGDLTKGPVNESLLERLAFANTASIAAISITYINIHGRSRTKLVSNAVSDRWLRKRRQQQILDIKAGKTPRFRPCSGQSTTAWEWSVCDALDPEWRPLARDGRKRLFPSHESAQRYASRLNRAEVEHD